MNILCDQCVNQDVINALRSAGFNCVHTADVRLSHATDQDIFRYAQRSGRILFTFDHGFGNITQFSIRNAHGVVLMYIAEMNKQAIIDRALYIFQHVLKHRQAARHLFVVNAESVRIWPKG